MTRIPVAPARLALALIAAAALAGCDQSDHNIVAGPNIADDGSAPVNVANVALPPPITASKSYRCKDNSVVYIDWYGDGTARVKTSQTDVGTSVKPGEGPLKGDAKAATITYNGKSCKA